MVRALTLAVLCCLWGMGGPAFAQDTATPEGGDLAQPAPSKVPDVVVPAVFNRSDRGRFRRFLRRDENMRQAREDYLDWLNLQRRPDCMDNHAIEIDDVNGGTHRFEDENPSLNYPSGADRPINAVWLERYEVSICGIREPAAARLEIHDSGPVQMQWVPAGNTHVPIAQIRAQWRGLVRLAIQGATRMGGCRDEGTTPESALLDTNRTGMGPGVIPLASETAWNEDWVFRLCGRNVHASWTIRNNADQSPYSITQRVDYVYDSFGQPVMRREENSVDAEEAERLRQRREQRDPYYRDRSRN